MPLQAEQVYRHPDGLRGNSRSRIGEEARHLVTGWMGLSGRTWRATSDCQRRFGNAERIGRYHGATGATNRLILVQILALGA